MANVTLQQIRDFFIGENKYTVANSTQTVIYDRINGTPIRYVKAGDTIGQVIDINSSGEWGLLKGGGWIKFSNDMYTYIRTYKNPVNEDLPKQVLEGVGVVGEGLFSGAQFLARFSPVIIVALLFFIAYVYFKPVKA